MSGRAGSLVCPSCGRPNSSGAANCAACGTPLFTALGFGASAGSARPTSPSVRTHHAEPNPFPPQYETDADERLQPLATRGAVPGLPYEGPRRRIVRKRFSNPPTIIGLVLAIAGLLVVVGIYQANARPSTQQVGAGSVWTVAPDTLTGLVAHVQWTSNFTHMQVYVVFGKPSCFSPAGVVANGSGENGSLKAAMDPGTTYYMFGCVSGNPSNVTLTVHFDGGLTLGEVVASFLAGIGVGLVAMGLRGRSVEVVTR